MAYIIGIVSEKEEKELERIGWDIEHAPEPFKDIEVHGTDRVVQIWVDANVFDIMTGPDWDVG